MSNLEHIFEVTLDDIKNNKSRDEWLNDMLETNCYHNAEFSYPMKHGKTGAKLNDNTTVCLDNVWILANYTYPLLKEEYK